MTTQNLIAYLASKNERRCLEILAKIEYGVAIFCRKLAAAAASENNLNLAKLLLDHAEEEQHHGRMLSSLADGREQPVFNGTGAFLKVIRGGQNIINNRSFPVSNPLTLVWKSEKFTGEQLTGEFENFDGLSKRYWSLRLFLGNRHAFDYSWGDRLCFMHVLECETRKVHEALSKSNCSPALKAIASKIAQDEEGHSNYLFSLIYCFPNADLEKWRGRVFWAKLGLIIDICTLMLKSKAYFQS